MKVTLLLMTLNEIDGMKAVLPKIDRRWCDQMIVVDGGSTDGTVQWARGQGLEVVEQDRRGIRNGYKQVWPHIQGDCVITFSPDGNSLAEAIPQLIAKMQGGYDMVIASRYLGDARSEDDDVVTSFGNWLFTKTVNVLFGGNYTDVMVMLRAYRRDLIYALGLDKDDDFTFVERLFGTGYGCLSWEPLLSVLALKHKYRVAEIPASEPQRIGGERKLRVLRWGGACYMQFLREFFRPVGPKRVLGSGTLDR